MADRRYEEPTSKCRQVLSDLVKTRRAVFATLKPAKGDAIVVARDVNQFRHCNGRWRSIDLIDNNRVASFCIPPIGLLQSFRRRHQLHAKAQSSFARSHSSIRVTTGNNRNVCSFISTMPPKAQQDIPLLSY